MNITDIVPIYLGYAIANTSVSEDLSTVGIPLPVPEEFDQEKLFEYPLDHTKDRYLYPARLIATPEEIESSTDPDDIYNSVPPQSDIVWRLKEEVAKQYGLKSRWTFGNDTSDVDLPDGTKKTFPEGSILLSCEYDPQTSTPTYERPEGSL
jgi:hypothetical protein